MQRTVIALFALFLALAAALAFTPAPARADGIIIPEPPVCFEFDCPVPPPPPHEVPYLTVQNHQVNVTIANQVATTRVDQVFRNDTPWTLEGKYVFPLPEGAVVNDFAMWINGQRVEGQLYTKEEARRIYDDIVRRRLDPALLEYVGRDLFQASIFPIPPGETRRVEIEYSQVLPVDNGLVQYVYPLSTEKFSAKPLEKVAITVEITSNDPIKAIYSSSHPVSIERDGRYRAIAGWEAANVTPNTDFSLYYSVSTKDIGLNLLSTQPQGEDGFFMLLVAPNVDAEQIIEKDVILVLDTSGSMEGEKMEQARAALKYVLAHLNEGDRFNVIAFSTGLRAFADRPQALSTLSEAQRFVDSLRAEGSTDINRALLEAMAGADQERPTTLIFLTDGLPTGGVTDTPLILANINQAAPSNLRLFSFGVGDDVDTVLLDTLAQEQRGASAYVRPGERVDEQVGSFYAKVSTPVLADLALEVDGVQLEDTYPYPLPDLFAGTQLVLTGRYRQGGPASLTLTGQVNGVPQTFRYDDLSFATAPNRSADFIPRLWATRKVGYLLNQVRLNGENPEIIQEIVNLSVRYGIMTPYTSFLVEEPELALSNEGRQTIAQDAYAEAAAAPPAAVSGEAAVQKAIEQNALAGAEMAAPMPLITATEADGQGGAASTSSVAAVGDKAFVLKNGVWTDTTFDSTTMTTTPLPFASDKFMEFFNQHPEMGKYFALGPQVIVVLDGAAYETTPGEVSEIAPPIAPEAQPVAMTSQTQPDADTATSPQPAAAQVALTADVTGGAAPLAVNFTGQLVSAPGDPLDIACQASQFEFGDGQILTTLSECGQGGQRRDTANYVYERPGTYEVVYTLGKTASAPLTIVVSEAGQASNATATPVAAANVVTTPEPAAQAAPVTAIPANSQGSILSTLGLWGLILLPLVGVAVGWFIWGRKG